MNYNRVPTNTSGGMGNVLSGGQPQYGGPGGQVGGQPQYGGSGGYQGAQGEGERGFNIIQKIRDGLAKRGNRTIRSIGRCFRLLDSYDNNRKVEPEEFAVGMRENGVNLTQQELATVIKYMDRDGNGYLNYDEFLYAIRGRPNKVRQDIIDKAFKQMDRDNTGQIDKVDLNGTYDVSKHPKFNNGKTASQIQDDFLENFGDVNKDGSINKIEWDDYYAAVSASVDNDDHFIMIMQSAWKMKK